MIKKRLKPWVLITITIICLIGIIYSSYEIVLWKINVDENNKIKEKTNKSIKIKIDNADIKYDIDFKSLKEKNPDTIAYIKVNNTNIDYVVVKGKNNSYYLKHNFDKKYNIAGWIFADYHNRFDETDKNIVIYGHDTKDGSMFDTLKNTLNKEWYENKDNRKIVLVTENNTYYYEVFSNYTIDVEDYYINTIFNSDEEFNKFVNKLKSRSIYDYNVDVDENSKILTLSSCMNNDKKRVVLHAKLLDSHFMSSK